MLFVAKRQVDSTRKYAYKRALFLCLGKYDAGAIFVQRKPHAVHVVQKA